MITRSTQNHKPAKRIKVKRRFYEELVAENAMLKLETEHHEHNKALLEQTVAYLQAIQTNNTETQKELEARTEELRTDIRG